MALDTTQNKLSEAFEVKNLNEVSFCLDVELIHDSNKIGMNQTGYINDLIER